MPDAAHHLYTIGHSNVALADFLGLLHQYGIEAVADVRSREDGDRRQATLFGDGPGSDGDRGF